MRGGWQTISRYNGPSGCIRIVASVALNAMAKCEGMLLAKMEKQHTLSTMRTIQDVPPVRSLTRLVAGTQTGLLGSRMNLPYRAVSKHLGTMGE